MSDDESRRDLLVAVAALGGDDIDPALAAEALDARTAALDSIALIRSVRLGLVGAIEPGHANRRLTEYPMTSRP